MEEETEDLFKALISNAKASYKSTKKNDLAKAGQHMFRVHGGVHKLCKKLKITTKMFDYL